MHSRHHLGDEGHAPVVKTTGARFGFNMISAVNANGQCRCMIIERRVTAVVFCEFLRRLLQGMTRKIVLIVDGHPTHKAKRVQRFVAAQARGLELCVLPPYSPDLNPDELAWAHVEGETGLRRTPDKDGVESPRLWHPAQPAIAAASGPQILPRTLVRRCGRMRLY